VPLGWEGTGRTRPDPPADYRAFLDPNGLNGARLGVSRQGIDDNAPPQVIAIFDAALTAIQAAGATLVNLPAGTFTPARGEFEVLSYDFKLDVRSYFGTRVGVPVAGGTLADAIAFNSAHADTEMPYFFQEIFQLANAMNTSGPDPGNNPQPIFGGRTYNQARALDHAAGVSFDQVLANNQLLAIVAPTDSPGWTTDLLLSDHFLFASSGLAGGPGYAIIQVPAGNFHGMPMGISFLGTAFSEGTLIRLASGFEAVTHARIQPTFVGNITTEHTGRSSPMAEPPAPKSYNGPAPHRM